MDEVYPYVKNEQLYNCPSDTRATKFIYVANNRAAGSAGRVNYGSYAANAAYYQGSGITGVAASPPLSDPANGIRNLAAMQKPAETVWAVDTTNGGGNGSFGWANVTRNPVVVAGSNPRVSNPGNIVERHMEFTNVIWMDGHSKSMKLSMLLRTNANNIMPYFTNEDD